MALPLSLQHSLQDAFSSRVCTSLFLRSTTCLLRPRDFRRSRARLNASISTSTKGRSEHEERSQYFASHEKINVQMTDRQRRKEPSTLVGANSVSGELDQLGHEIDDSLSSHGLAAGSMIPPPQPTAPTSLSPVSMHTDPLPSLPRLPRSVQAIYLKPLKRRAQYGLPVCDLQLRSYHVRNLEFFADFALRAAYYLRLPAAGPVPLPRITERWTVPRSNFVHKKSQENFERITMRRLIQIKDGHPDTVETWLVFLRKYAYHGIGMKANVWKHEKLGA